MSDPATWSRVQWDRAWNAVFLTLAAAACVAGFLLCAKWARKMKARWRMREERVIAAAPLIVIVLGVLMVIGLALGMLLSGCTSEKQESVVAWEAPLPAADVMNENAWWLRVPEGYSLYRIVRADVNLCEGWPDDVGHWMTWTPGDLLLLPDRHEVEGLVSSGAIEPWPNVRPSGGGR